MKTNNNIPAYRFQGYTDAWEQRSFGDLAEYKKGPFGSAITKSMFVPKSQDSVKVYEQQNAISKNWKLERYFLPKSYALSHLKSFVVYGGDIIVSCAGTIGEIYEIPEDAELGIINQALMRVRVEMTIVEKNIFAIAFSNMIDNFSRTHSNGSAIKNIPPFADLKSMKISLPTLPEQKVMGTFFSYLDQLITLHQRKLDTFKEQKKTYLKLLFPAKGQTKPTLRFQGFEDDWEEVKLGDVVEKSGSGGTPKSTNKSYYGGNIPFLSITDITQSGKYITNTEKTLTELGLENSSAWIVPKGAISLAMYASVGKLAILKTDVATSQAFFNMVFSNEIVRDYVYFILDKAQIFNEWLPLISTGTQGNLNAQ
ncbi:TPA: restriction endonuclease subunit S, partial [Streptococcus suis]